ncbi:MAG: inorganic diphosphatase [Pseudomonadota bacterium]
MILDRVGAGEDVPNSVNVIIEVPAYSAPVKYEVDKDSGAMFVDRFIATPMHYPANYGYIPHTLMDDGDPADMLVITPFPLMAGTVVRCRPIAMLNMSDESGRDEKLVGVPIAKLTKLYSKINDINDLHELQVQQIKHFFEHYKDLEEGKWVKVEDWVGAEAAKAAIIAAVARAKAAKTKHHHSTN